MQKKAFCLNGKNTLESTLILGLIDAQQVNRLPENNITDDDVLLVNKSLKAEICR